MKDYWWFEDEGAGTSPHQYSWHNHWRQPVYIKRYIVTCSALTSKSKDLAPYPDFGIYLSSNWQRELGTCWTNGSYLKALARERLFPAMIIDWMDGSAVGAERLNSLVNICLSKMRHGKRIDIGCFAGHGRTGTLLACLIARIEHLEPWQAIEAARNRYCQFAIENKTQENSIAEYVKHYVPRLKFDLR